MNNKQQPTDDRQKTATKNKKTRNKKHQTSKIIQ